MSTKFVRIDSDVHEQLKLRAEAERRTISAVASFILAQFLKSTPREGERKDPLPPPSTAPAVLETRPAPVPSGTRATVGEVMQLVHDHLPSEMWRLKRIRTGLEEQVKQMVEDGCDPHVIGLSLREYSSRTGDVYPGHLPHIYRELLAKQTAPRPKGKMVEKMEGYRAIKEQWQRIADEEENTIEGEVW